MSPYTISSAQQVGGKMYMNVLSFFMSIEEVTLASSDHEREINPHVDFSLLCVMGL